MAGRVRELLLVESVFALSPERRARRLRVYAALLAAGGFQGGALFFTGPGVRLAVRPAPGGSEGWLEELQQGCLALAGRYGLALLVCGRELKERGFAAADLREGFTPAGDMEFFTLAERAAWSFEL